MPQVDDEDDRPRDKRTTSERLDLLERDVRSHARSLTALVTSSKSFSTEQMEQLRTAFREELADAGLRIDGPEHVDLAREDFRFLRRLRTGTQGTAAKVGWAVIFAILSAAVWLFTNGINAWKGGP
jgi:cell division protein FtsX